MKVKRPTDPKESTDANSFELVFVYNADSGFVNALGDALHKLISPQTYPCSLCALTYTAVEMRAEWQGFVEGLELPVRFLHADELKRAYGEVQEPLPAIFTARAGQLTPWVDKAAIDSCQDLAALERLVTAKLEADRDPVAGSIWFERQLVN